MCDPLYWFGCPGKLLGCPRKLLAPPVQFGCARTPLNDGVPPPPMYWDAASPGHVGGAGGWAIVWSAVVVAAPWVVPWAVKTAFFNFNSSPSHGDLAMRSLYGAGVSGLRLVGGLEALGPPGFLILFIDLPSVDGCIRPVKYQEERTQRVSLGLGYDLVIVPV